MKTFWKNYGDTLLLLLGLLVGGVIGAVWGDGAHVLQPVGALFLNLVFVLVVPLVFFSVAQSMVVMRRSGVIGKVLGTALLTFFCLSMAVGILSYAGMSVWNPFAHITAAAEGGLQGGSLLAGSVNWADALVSTFTVNDFPLLFSREHLLPLILFAALFGLAVALLGQKADTIGRFIEEGGTVIMKMMGLIMKLAPVGIGCYFADIIGDLGGQIVGDYLEVFLVVCAVSAVCYLILFPLLARFCGVPLSRYWKEMIPLSAAAVGTCSSAACLPLNLTAAKNLGVSEKTADGVIPLGTNLHKLGSVIVSVAKVLFALYFFGGMTGGIGTAALVVGLAWLESIVVGAIPVGGMTGEILICAVLGLDPAFAATLMIIATISDIPGTLLNVSGNLLSSLIVHRVVK